MVPGAIPRQVLGSAAAGTCNPDHLRRRRAGSATTRRQPGTTMTSPAPWRTLD